MRHSAIFDVSMKKFLPIVLAVLLVLVWVISLVAFINRNNDITDTRAYNTLQADVGDQRARIGTVLDNEFYFLEGIANYIATTDVDERDIVATMNSLLLSDKYFRLSYCDISGNAVSSENEHFDVQMGSYFYQALNGERAVSQPLASIVSSDTDIVVLAVPVIKGFDVVGVVTGAIALDDFASLLVGNKDVLNNGQYHIIQPNGEYIAYSFNGEVSLNNENFFDMLTGVRFESEKDRTALLYELNNTQKAKGFFNIDGSDYYMMSIDLQYNHWILVNIVPKAYFVDVMRDINENTTWFVCSVIISFALCGIYIILAAIADSRRLADEKSKAEWDQAKYRLVAEASDTLIFEANYEKRSFETNSCVYKLFGRELTYDDAIEGTLVYSEDKERYEEALQSVRDGESFVVIELRFVSVTGRVFWARETIMSMYNSDKRLVNMVGKIEDIDQDKKTESVLRKRAETDSLTGLYNKLATKRLISEIMSQKTVGKCFGLLVMDLNHFKEINDCYGHIEGDKAIVDVAEKMRSYFRSSDIVGRIGGDEFMILINDLSTAEQLGVIAETFARELVLTQNCCSHYKVTVSIGGTIINSDTKSFDEVYAQADKALYCVKNSKDGKIYALYSPEMSIRQHKD